MSDYNPRGVPHVVGRLRTPSDRQLNPVAPMRAYGTVVSGTPPRDTGAEQQRRGEHTQHGAPTVQQQAEAAAEAADREESRGSPRQISYDDENPTFFIF